MDNFDKHFDRTSKHVDRTFRFIPLVVAASLIVPITVVGGVVFVIGKFAEWW